MDFRQLYETLIQRDLFFYILPGAFTLGTGILITKISLPENSWITLSQGIRDIDKLYFFILFLFISYLIGFLMYILHNKTIGKTNKLKRHLILQNFLFSDEKKDDKLIQQIKDIFVKSIFPDYKSDNKLTTGELLQLYFTADKYIRLKNLDFYSVYISRLTATSRFCGVMSVSFIIIAIFSIFILFYNHLFIHFILVIFSIIIFIFVSRLLFKQSIVDQEELVWNVIQGSYLIYTDEKIKNENEIKLKEIKSA